MRLGSTVAIVLLLVPALAASATAERTVEADYALGTGPLSTACEGRSEGVGGACFAVEATDERVDLTVSDETWRAVGARWSTVSADGVVYHSQTFCTDASVLNPSPEDFPVDRLRVTVLAPGVAAQVCPSAPAFGTQGTITATFTS